MLHPSKEHSARLMLASDMGCGLSLVGRAVFVLFLLNIIKVEGQAFS